MRFSFDELYGIESPELWDAEEYSIIESDDELIPRLRIPRQLEKFDEEDGEHSLKDQLEDENLALWVANLDLTAKLPGSCKLGNIITTRIPRHEGLVLKPLITDINEEREDVQTEPVNAAFTELQDAMTREILRKVETLQEKNDEQVRNVQAEKLRKQEEQRRREKEQRDREHEEKRQREEQERLKREQEEEQRRQDEAKKKQAAMEAKAREEERLKQEKLAAQKEIEAAEKRAREDAARGRGITNFSDIQASFHHYKHKIKQIKHEVVEPVKKDANLKSILSKHKRKINPKFGQLTNSETHLHSIILEMTSLVDQTKPNNLGYQWILNFIAKALVSQAETEVRVKPESALPLAKLALTLLAQYPELLELLMARFVKKCPFVIGFSCAIDSETGRYNMGWKRSQDNTWEEETSYDERMGGIVTLFATITRLPLPADLIGKLEHPLPIQRSWQLVARVANTSLQLLNNTHFVVLGCWWDAAAAQLLQAYARQGHKLLALISTDLTSSVAERRYVGAARLRILFEEYESTGRPKSFPEMKID
ncbi:LAFA_0F18360g1_1 [Lachancea sp. 'fantastica']|nr:LAFA_0F18360g1_1 [Lachancea sp. 'fantastica']